MTNHMMNIVDIYGTYSSNFRAVISIYFFRFFKFSDGSLGFFQLPKVQQFS